MYKVLVINIRNTIIHEEDIIDSVDACKAHDIAVSKYSDTEDIECPPYRVLFMETCKETIL